MSSSRRQSQSRPRPSRRRSTSSSLPVVNETDEENSTQATAKTTGSASSLENGAAAGDKPADLSGTTKKQRALLKGTKLLVFISLMVGALGFAIATYVFARTGERNAFQRQVRRGLDKRNKRAFCVILVMLVVVFVLVRLTR